jgi:hypothetical protein
MKKYFACVFFLIATAYGQVSGCTDSMALNFDSAATTNDGSCLYKSIKIKPQYTVRLSDSIRETSGLLFFDNLLWTHNDDHDTTIYGMDTLGNIRKKVLLNKVLYHDWEEIQQDANFLYIGDFGNNAAGNRENLHILKIEKKSFLKGNPIMDTISFSYANQINFKANPNKTSFDCEAFIVKEDSIYLFTKEWKTSKTSIYSVPKYNGHYTAQFKETLSTNGLITGAAYYKPGKIIALCGYSKRGKPFLYLLYDYNKSSFLSGNKRRIKIRSAILQIEGIATRDGLRYYISNEALVRRPIINIPQQLHYFDLSPLLSSYLKRLSDSVSRL